MINKTGRHFLIASKFLHTHPNENVRLAYGMLTLYYNEKLLEANQRSTNTVRYIIENHDNQRTVLHAHRVINTRLRERILWFKTFIKEVACGIR